MKQQKNLMSGTKYFIISSTSINTSREFLFSGNNTSNAEMKISYNFMKFLFLHKYFIEFLSNNQENFIFHKKLDFQIPNEFPLTVYAMPWLGSKEVLFCVFSQKFMFFLKFFSQEPQFFRKLYKKAHNSISYFWTFL